MKIPEEILKGLEKESYPKTKLGGQTVGLNSNGITLSHYDLGFSISIQHYRSQLKNLEFAMTVFELYYDEISRKL